MSHLEDNLFAFLRGIRCPEPQRQYQFDPARKWQIDFAWPEVMLAVEIDGGTKGKAVTCHSCGVKVRALKANGRPGRELRIGGGHSRGKSHEAQYEKQNAMVLAGWTVLRYCSQQIHEDTPAMLYEIRDTYFSLTK